jgi:ribosomal protein L37AE/L43A
VSIPGYAENAVCPKCETYTQQYIVVRGIRKCLNCGEQFNLKDTERINHGRVIKPVQKEEECP